MERPRHDGSEQCPLCAYLFERVLPLWETWTEGDQSARAFLALPSPQTHAAFRTRVTRAQREIAASSLLVFVPSSAGTPIALLVVVWAANFLESVVFPHSESHQQLCFDQMEAVLAWAATPLAEAHLAD